MRYKKIAEIADVVTGGTPSTSKPDYWDDGTIPWLQSGCCQNCDVVSTEKYITRSGYDNSSAKMMVPDTVMIALTGATAGKVGYLKFAACGNQSITGILPSERINSRFLFYYLISKREHILADCIGGAQPHISQGYVKNILIPDITLEEQEKVVTELEKVSIIIREREKQIKLFDELVKARFVELFGDPVANNMQWNKDTLLGILEEGRTVTYGIVQTGDDVEDGIPVFRPIDIAGGHIPKREELKRTLPEISEKYKRTLLNGTELLVTVRGSVGETFQVSNEFEGCNVGRNIVPLLTDKERIKQRFLQELFAQQSIKDWLKAITKGIALQGLNMSEFKEMPVIVPPMELQEKYVDFAEQVDKSKVEVQKTLEKTQLLFDSLMQEYFGT